MPITITALGSPVTAKSSDHKRAPLPVKLRGRDDSRVTHVGELGQLGRRTLRTGGLLDVAAERRPGGWPGRNGRVMNGRRMAVPGLFQTVARPVHASGHISNILTVQAG